MTERAMQLQGLATEWRTMAYTWRDCALYALAVGATGEEPQYTYEKDMQVIPTFGVLPYWGAVNVTPQFPRPRAVPVLVEELLRPAQSYVNLDYEFLYHRPIPAGKGSFVYRDVLTDLFDRGEGRGMAVRSQVEVFDEGGVLLCTNRCTTLFPTLGGYGGQPMDRRASRIPDRAPDFVARDHIGAAQHLLYRLTGDTNLVHVDRAVAESRGLQGPFVHDLCAFGYACRLAIGQCFPGQPERLQRMYGAMKTVLYPDTPVELHLWQTGPGQGAFRLVNAASGKPRLMLLLETICATGIRVSEVKYITLEAARQGRAEITLKGKVRTILLPGKLCRKLLKYARKQNILSGEIFLTRGGRRLNRKNIWAEMKALCPAAGVAASKVFPHNLRHLFAKCFYDACRDLVKLADVLGHSSVETTRIYLLSTGTQHVKLLERLGLVGETETAQRPSASVIEAEDSMREVAGNVAQNNCIHYADAHDACYGKSDRKTGWADRETRAAPAAFLG